MVFSSQQSERLAGQCNRLALVNAIALPADVFSASLAPQVQDGFYMWPI